jgi:hypothetical protein
MRSHQDQPSAMERWFRGADWRYQAAVAAARSGGNLRSAGLDELTRRAADFFRLRNQIDQGVELATNKHPDIAAAEKVWANPTVSEHMQLLVLGNCPAGEIAGRLGLVESVVAVVEGLYFDVRSAFEQPIWISGVIAEVADRGHDDLAARMRTCYFGGPNAARALLNARIGLPVTAVARLATASILLHSKLMQAAEMPLDASQTLEFRKLASEIHFDEQRLQLEREKLTARMLRWAQHRELAQARIDLERQRLEHQAGGAEVGASAAESDPPASVPLPSTPAA